jgi:prephenate dehydrogenase
MITVTSRDPDRPAEPAPDSDRTTPRAELKALAKDEPGTATDIPAADQSSEKPPLPTGLCVLGLGLIGGSLLRVSAGHIADAYGWSPSARTREQASAEGFEVLDDLDAALRRAARSDALVVMASPVTAFDELLEAVSLQSPQVLLTDVGGVKQPVAEQVRVLTPQARYIGSHPMTGTTRSGWPAGSADLFADRVWVTSFDDDADMDDWAPIAGLALTVGSRVVPIEPGNHDDAAARISHLPHLMAAALAQVGAAGGPVPLALAAGSFTDGTRVAGTRPELVRAMCETNAEPLISALDEALALLGVARASLASTGSIGAMAERGHDARGALLRRFDDLQPITLGGTDLAEQLLSVGSAGGYVTAVRPAGSGWSVAAMYPIQD